MTGWTVRNANGSWFRTVTKVTAKKSWCPVAALAANTVFTHNLRIFFHVRVQNRWVQMYLSSISLIVLNEMLYSSHSADFKRIRNKILHPENPTIWTWRINFSRLHLFWIAPIQSWKLFWYDAADKISLDGGELRISSVVSPELLKIYTFTIWGSNFEYGIRNLTKQSVPDDSISHKVVTELE